MTSCHQSTRNCKSIQDKRRKKNEKKVLQHTRRCGRSERKLIATRSAFGGCRTKSTGTEWSLQKWQHNFRGCRQEKKEEAAMLRKRWIVAWRRWWNSSSLWEQCKFDATPLLRRCQEKEEEEGIVRTNKSKAKPVSSWRCQQAGAMKALQRVVWSLIFLVFGVHTVNAEEQGNQAQIMSEKDPYPTLVRFMRIINGNGMSFDGNSQRAREDPTTFKEPVERWRVQEKRKEEM